MSLESINPPRLFLAKWEINVLLSFYPIVHQVGGARCLTAPPDFGEQPRGPANPVSTEEDSFHFNRLRVRADEAERRLRVVEADAAILKSKQAAMVEQENFLLYDMRQLSEQIGRAHV